MVPKQGVRWGRRNGRNQRAWWQSAPSCFPWATLRSRGWFQQRTLANLTHPWGVKAEATAESCHEQQPPMLAESSLSDSMQIGASLSWHLCCLASHIKLWVQNLSFSFTDHVFTHLIQLYETLSNDETWGQTKFELPCREEHHLAPQSSTKYNNWEAGKWSDASLSKVLSKPE